MNHRHFSEHPVSHSLSASELDELILDYKRLGEDLIFELEIAWDMNTEFSKFHDLSVAESAAEYELQELTKNQFRKHVWCGENYTLENFWDTGSPRKIAGVIYAILEGVSLTPPLLNADEELGWLYPKSGCHRLAVAAVAMSGPIPILIMAEQRESFKRMVPASGTLDEPKL